MIRTLALLLACFWAAAGQAQNELLTALNDQTATGGAIFITDMQDWQLTCQSDAAGRACAVTTPLRAQGQAPVTMQGTLAASDQEPVFAVTVPLGLAIQAGGRLDIDGRRIGTFGVRTCRVDGCPIPFRFSGSVARRMRAGIAVELTLQALDGTGLTYQGSLLGLTAALEGASRYLAGGTVSP